MKLLRSIANIRVCRTSTSCSNWNSIKWL